METRLKEKIEEKIEKARKGKVTFLLAGRAGMGKSSTINSLLGEEKAKVSAWVPGNRDVKGYTGAFKLDRGSVLNGVEFTVFDTPGLCDAPPRAGNDQRYLKRIRDAVERLDCLFFVTHLDARVDPSEGRSIELITKAFGEKIWKHAIIVFTCANNLKVSGVRGPAESSADVRTSYYREALETRTGLLRDEIAKHVAPRIAKGVPAIAIDNGARSTPDGKEWLAEFYVTVFERMDERGCLSFLVATHSRVIPPRSGGSSTSGWGMSSWGPSYSSSPVQSSASRMTHAGSGIVPSSPPPIAPDAGQMKRMDSVVTRAAKLGAEIGRNVGTWVGRMINRVLGRLPT
ncbi:GTPase [Archangium lansingense]|uniref:GTPase n=1 Tax=Archangium lansingense TaxID=2995310 RepID=UPI003B76466C